MTIRDPRRFSELAATYLEQLDEIRAGEAALQRDIGKILDSLAIELSAEAKRPVEVQRDSIRRALPLPGRELAFGLGLRWGPPDWERPTLVTDVETGARAEPALGALFARALHKLEHRFGAVEPTLLWKDPVRACGAIWRDAWSSVEQFAGGAEVSSRLRGFDLMKQVSQILSRDPKCVGRHADLWSLHGELRSERQWPCQCGWTQVLDGSGAQVRWWVDYDPDPGPTGGAAVLKLVVQKWGPIKDQLVELPKFALSDDTPLIVRDLTRVLDALAEGTVDAHQAARKVAFKALESYQQVLARMGLSV